jgi:uncharacterized integral membrane protein
MGTLCIATEVMQSFPTICDKWYDMIYLLTAIGLSPSGSSTVHIYTQTIHRTIQQLEQCWLCPILASYTLAFALQRKKNTEKPQSG